MYEKTRIHELIPGGAHTYTKGDDQFPANAPDMIERGDGAYVFDREGNRYLDMSMGLTSVILGHGYEPVLERAREELKKGVNFQRPATIELEFAEMLNDLFPWFDQFKFAKNGSTVTTAAVKLARAYTGRDKVAVCGDHDFFSYDDWYIGTTVMDRGIPQAYKELTLTFPYGDLEATEQIFQKHEGEIACVILEPVTFHEPPEDYLQKFKELCHKYGVVFILDEIITGFKWNVQGAHSVYDVQPDLATFGKSIANGFSVDLLAGKDEIMRLGGLHHDEERVFLASTTNGAETHGLAAAMKTIEEMKCHEVIPHRRRLGEKLIEGINQLSANHGLEEYIQCIGLSPLPLLDISGPNESDSNAFKTLLMQELCKRNVLSQPLLSISYSHTEDDIDRYLDGLDESLEVFGDAVDQGSVESHLEGHIIQPVFRKEN